MVKMVITGYAGFIGSHLADLLLKKGHQVVGIDNYVGGNNRNKNVDERFVDIRDYKDVVDAMKGCEIVFHLAARPRVLYSINNPIETFDVNVKGTLNIILAAKECGVKKLIFASSSSVCGDPSVFPTPETEPYSPLSPYSTHKATGELLMKTYSALFGIDMTCVRFFNVYGTRASPDGQYALMIPKFIKKIYNDEEVVIYGDGTQSRSFVYIEDAIKGMHDCINLEGYNIINLGGETHISVNQCIGVMCNILKKSPTVTRTKPNKGEAMKTHADITKARKLLNWRPITSIEEGIRKVIESGMHEP